MLYEVITRHKRRRSFIGAIKVTVELTMDDKEIKEGIVEVFQNIFMHQEPRTVSMDFMHFNKITDDMSIGLENDVIEEECPAATKKLGKLKTPGLDEFSISFYVLCWDFLKNDIMAVFKELQGNNFLDWRLKNSFIDLIPEKDSLEEIKDLRPISLVHGVCRIILPPSYNFV